MADQEYKIIQWNDVWEHKDGWCDMLENDDINFDLEFKCTHVYFKKWTALFKATTDQRESELATLHLTTIERTAIPREEIYPVYQEHFTMAPEPLPENVYIKHTRMAYYHANENGTLARRLLNEVQMYEALKDAPHPNIAQYHGCVVEDGRITGIVLKHYATGLADRIWKGPPISKEQGCAYASGVDAAARHLQKLGYALGNIHMGNVMLDGETPVLIGFERASFEGCTGCRAVSAGTEEGSRKVEHDHSLGGILRDLDRIRDVRVGIIVAQFDRNGE